MINLEKPIGIFDSGVGGLTVFAQIMKTLPNENIVYFGDTLRAPYGDKSTEQLKKYSRQIIDFLKTYDIKALVIGCGTISANCAEYVKGLVNIPVLDMVSPSIEDIISIKAKKIGIIATKATIDSKIHEKLIKKQNKDCKVYARSCPLFVPVVEEGFADTAISDLVAKEYISYFLDKDLDAMVLGCTHYPLLSSSIAKVFESKIRLIDPAFTLSKHLLQVLTNKGLKNTQKAAPKHNFFISSNTQKFDTICSKALLQPFKASIHKL